jgi:hypothetical protein
VATRATALGSPSLSELEEVVHLICELGNLPLVHLSGPLEQAIPGLEAPDHAPLVLELQALVLHDLIQLPHSGGESGVWGRSGCEAA